MDYSHLSDPASIDQTAAALQAKGYQVFLVENRQQALEKIQALIPAGASVMNGSSKTLEQIGYLDYLKSGQHPWKDLHQAVSAENDKAKRNELRRQSILSDYYLGSVHALTSEGEFIIASNTGSQLPHIVFSSPNLIFVVGGQKIVPNLAEAMKRLQEYVVPLEDQNMKQKYGSGTMLSKIVTFKQENKSVGRTVNLILVKEPLGF
jgi:L-lactate utilization protein LutB